MSEFWKHIWDEKRRKDTSNLDTKDPMILTGYNVGAAKDECKIISFKDRWEMIKNKFNISDNNSVLEIGSAAGCLAQYAHDKYIGIDFSEYMVEKFNELNKNKLAFVINDTTNIFFPDKSFDYVISDSIFHYFPNHDYASKVINEMKRISKKFIIILNLRYDKVSQRKEHLKLKEIFFIKNDMKIFQFEKEKEYFYNCYYKI